MGAAAAGAPAESSVRLNSSSSKKACEYEKGWEEEVSGAKRVKDRVLPNAQRT
jgi:hypothetical protein